jgi:hypothetical protein
MPTASEQEAEKASEAIDADRSAWTSGEVNKRLD